jgi:hypothetical protein
MKNNAVQGIVEHLLDPNLPNIVDDTLSHLEKLSNMELRDLQNAFAGDKGKLTLVLANWIHEHLQVRLLKRNGLATDVPELLCVAWTQRLKHLVKSTRKTL